MAYHDVEINVINLLKTKSGQSVFELHNEIEEWCKDNNISACNFGSLSLATGFMTYTLGNDIDATAFRLRWG